jgi:hypothetical protein
MFFFITFMSFQMDTRITLKETVTFLNWINQFLFGEVNFINNFSQSIIWTNNLKES